MKIEEPFRSLGTMMHIGNVCLLIDNLLLYIVFSWDEILFHRKVKNKM